MRVPKAQPVGVRAVADCIIEITEPLPEGDTRTLKQWAEYYDEYALRLEGLLINSLPGGLYDRLLGRMLERKATHFRVAHLDA